MSFDGSDTHGLRGKLREDQRGRQLDINVLREEAPVETAPKKSYLDIVADHTIKPVFNLVLDDARAERYTRMTEHFGMMVPLFMKGKVATTGLALLYASNEAKWGDTLEDQSLDAVLGLGKGLGLKAGFMATSYFKHTPSMVGLELGILSRGSDSLLTRTNYMDKNGEYSTQLGVSKFLSTTFRPENMAMDLVSFGVADRVWGRMYGRSRGAAFYNPLMTHTVTGASMGFAAGTGNEMVRQWDTKDFSLLRLAEASTAETLFGAIGGRIGGYQTKRYSEIDYASRADYKADSPRFTVANDQLQTQFTKGDFILDARSSNLTVEAWTGSVKMADGSMTPAIFRPDTPTNLAGYTERLMAETSASSLGRLTGIGDTVPLTVARSVEVNGKTYHGFMQQMHGTDLRKYLGEKAIAQFGTDSVANMQKVFRADPILQQNFANAMAERMIFGEWDNHSMNFLVENGFVRNVDMQDALKPARHTWDTKPDAGYLYGYEGLNNSLYADLVGKAAPAEFRAKAQQFVATYDNPIGRARLQEKTGWTYEQAEGVLGRARHFAENGVFPRPQHTSYVNPLLSAIKRAIKTGSFAKPAIMLDQRRLSGGSE